MKKQCVVRMVKTPPGYWYELNCFKHLQRRLEEGWVVVMCNPIGNDLEYVLEKEYEDTAEFR